MNPVEKRIGQQMIARYRQNRTPGNGESEMPKPKLKDQRPDYVLDRDAMAERMREAVEQCEDYGTTEIAEFCGCDRSLVYEWCRKGGSRPGIDNLTAFCKATGADWEWLMFGVTDEATFHKRTDDSNVVQMERPLDMERSPGVDSLLTRYIGVYELEEIQELIKKEPTKFLNEVQAFPERPKDRTSIAITLNPKKIDKPGIPSFCFQFLIDSTPWVRGAYIAYATDISPARGKFAIFAIKRKGEDQYTFANGFYFSINDRLLAAQMGENFIQRNRGFVLKLNPDEDAPDDVYVMPEDFENWERDCKFVGVATYKTEWLDVAQIQNHTGLSDRLDRVYESRKITE